MAIARKPAAKSTPAVAPAPAVEAIKPMPAKTVAAAEEPVSAAVKATFASAPTPEQMLGGAQEIQEHFRKAVEDGIARSRDTYEKMRTAAEEATGSLEASYAAATQGVNEFNARAIDVFKANSEANLEHVKSVMAAKSIGDAIALHSAHARKQFETLAEQAKELSTLAQKVAAASVEPLKASFGKTFAH